MKNLSTGNNKNMVFGNPRIKIKIRFFGRLREWEMHGVAKEEEEEDQIIN